MDLFVSGDRIQAFFEQRELKINISSVWNISNVNSKPKEFSLKDIQVLVDSEEQDCFKRAHVGKSLRLSQIEKSLVGLEMCETRARNYFDPTHTTTTCWSGSQDQKNKTDKFLSFFGVMYAIVSSWKDKGKALKDIVPRGFNARIEGIRGQHQQAIKE